MAPVTGEIIAHQKQQTCGEREAGQSAIRLGVGRQLVPVDPCQVETDQRNQEDVGVQFALEGKANEPGQGYGEAARQDDRAGGQEEKLAPEHGGERRDLSCGRRIRSVAMGFQGLEKRVAGITRRKVRK